MNVNRTSGFDKNFRAQLGINLDQDTGAASTAKDIGDRLHKAEKALLDELSKKEPDQGVLQALKIKYDRAMRLYEMFDKLVEASHQMIMRLISRISAR